MIGASASGCLKTDRKAECFTEKFSFPAEESRVARLARAIALAPKNSGGSWWETSWREARRP